MISCNAKQETKLTIKLTGDFPNYSTSLITADSIYKINMDGRKIFNIDIPADAEKGYCYFKYAGFYQILYIDKGLTLNISYIKRIETSFEGKDSSINNYMNLKIPFKFEYKKDEKNFILSYKKLIKRSIDKLVSSNLDSKFIEEEKLRIPIINAKKIIDYPIYHRGYSDRSYKISNDYYNFIKDIFKENSSYLKFLSYKDNLFQAVAFLTLRGPKTERNSNMEEPSNIYNLLASFGKSKNLTLAGINYTLNNFKDKKIISFLVDRLISNYIENNGIAELNEFLVIYNKNVIDNVSKKAFKELCESWFKIEKGQPSPKFTYKDVNEKEVSLTDLKGKYVYIDCWATWCGPCCKELPYLKELEEKFSDKNIYFVSISSDRDLDAWRNKVKNDKLGGIQLNSRGNVEFAEAFKIYMIPRFILLDKEGNIIDRNMSRPSAPETFKTLSNLKGI